MIFALPIPLPRSIFDNVTYGPRLAGTDDKATLDRIVEESLKAAYLWDEVKNRLRSPAQKLSGGQQQRLCIARLVAVKSEVLLMDEPCSVLDPLATLRIEELMRLLKTDYTIVIVTHNMQQAARVSDETGVMLLGELIESGRTTDIFTRPQDKRTETTSREDMDNPATTPGSSSLPASA